MSDAPVTRAVLASGRIHPAVRKKIALRNRAVVDEVEAAAGAHPVLVVGMLGNPHCARARRALRQAQVEFEYLEYGSYLSQWRRRNALKMWAGWPTFPMVFVKGTLVGGADDLIRLIAEGELQPMLA